MDSRIGRVAVLAVLMAVMVAAPATAAPTLLQLGVFATPTNAGAPVGDTHRLFVVEKGGTVRLLIDDVLQPTAFLDVTSMVSASTQEQGLLSIAFARDYALSGRFYIYLTATRAASVSGTEGELQVWEFRRSLANPDVADPASGRRLLTIEHSDAPNHNGGQLQIGPDDLVWMATGDGGGGGDGFHHAQDVNSRLGKLLRIDPSANPPTVTMLARGLRNPWRFSFDDQYGLVLADVGQGAYEEINVGLADNYGWPCREGLHAYGSDPGCDGVLTMDPVVERPHSDGVCSITGGYVSHDPGLPTLAGRYLYGDFCAPAIRSVDLSNPTTDAPIGVNVVGLSSFGVDGCRRLLVVSLNGPVSRVVDGALRACDPQDPEPAPSPIPTPVPIPTPAPIRTPAPPRTPTTSPTPIPTTSPAPTATPTPPPARTADVRPCHISMRVTGEHSLKRRKYLSVALRTDEACRATISAKTFKSASARLTPGTRTVIKLRRRTSGSRRIVISVRAVDAAGNTVTTTASVRQP